MIEILFNGDKVELPESQTVESFLNSQGLNAQRGVAIAINEQVVPKNLWSTRVLAPSDQLLIIVATQGG